MTNFVIDDNTRSNSYPNPYPNPLYKDLRKLFEGTEICYKANNWLQDTPMTRLDQAWSRCPRGEWLAYMVRCVLMDNDVYETPDTVYEALLPLMIKFYKKDNKRQGYSYPDDELIVKKFSNFYSNNKIIDMFEYAMGWELNDRDSLTLARAIRKHMTIIQEDGNLCVVWRHSHTLPSHVDNDSTNTFASVSTLTENTDYENNSTMF